MRFLALLGLAGAAWSAQATSYSTSVLKSDYDPQDEDDKEEGVAPTSDDAQDDSQDESMVQSSSTAETEVAATGWVRSMRVQRASHVRWMRSWSRRYNAWFRRSTKNYRARLVVTRRQHAAARRALKRTYGIRMMRQWKAHRVGGLIKVVREYQRKLRLLRIRQGRAFRSLAKRYIAGRRRYRAVALRRRSAHIRWHRRRMAKLKAGYRRWLARRRKFSRRRRFVRR
eukprot:CAMPEP_0204449340 /NCGR_PEP_ID=MMETSP0470-20130426/99787_1 /ASSEMBLY_ACC=CAM_ASM_000385 /TAXON_ID=2969 /ORGANISM="Oxyrrhis marina" /LENGTH=226 /DNA_ID=CAMNT_0051449157 /DNA_START=108 /DNA_END=785 /DNA_ORIENTATION=-